MGAVSLSAAWLPASAQTVQQEDRVTIPAPELRIEAPTRRHFMDEAEFGAFKGGYQLSNGQVLVLKRMGTRMYAEVGDMAAVALAGAARLSKADLLTDMVGEFPELQGIMGTYYA
eukprot:gene4791-5684_t